MADVRSFYEGQYARQKLATDASERKYRLQFCIESSCRDKEILDVGCGPGSQLSYLVSHN